METEVNTIIKTWQNENPIETGDISAVTLRYADSSLNIYTVEFYVDNTIKQVKAIGGIDGWKLINLT